MTEIASGSSSDYSSLKPVTTREELITLLARASELEHSLACAYLFAAYSLKSDVSEGGLTDAQASTVRGWRRNLATGALDRWLHLAQISNLLTAIGGAVHVKRPTFALVESVGLMLEPFSLSMLDRLVPYERLEAIIAKQAPSGDNGNTESQADEDVEDCKTSKDLYDKIAQGFESIPAEELFIGSAKAQVNPYFLNMGGPLVGVVDQASARSALVTITGIGNEAAATDPGAHTRTCEEIRAEYAAAIADAQQQNLTFEPVRPVGKNPRTHLQAPVADGTRIVEPLTVAVADLFNDAYDTMVLLLLRFFTHIEEENANLEQLALAMRRLMDSVVRPLGEALTHMPADNAAQPGICAGPTFGDRSNGTMSDLVHRDAAQILLDERLWHMATTATTLTLTPGLPTEVQEAAAALQDLACQFAPADGPRGVEAKVAALKQILAGVEGNILSALNGPYLVTNVESLKNWLWEPLPTRPLMALCRCGNSTTKPFCDGTHARIEFTTQKDPSRVPDHRDTYKGTAITIFDNRGICAHSGFCTDRLTSVFHAGQEPFVTPSGGRLDEIVRAVRSCPSGALSYAIGNVEAREQVDQDRPASIEVSKDGPYRITGGIALKNDQGNDEHRMEGVSREHYSLCRCGHSQNKPFCSGMHWYVNFHDPEVPEDHEPTLFEWAGGLPALLRMTHIFYEKYVPQEPLLQPLFANMSPDHPERVAAWLGEVFGGPKVYSGTYGGYPRMLSQHIGKGITEDRRARWAALISLSADEAGLPKDPEFRSAFASYVEWGSRLAVENSTVGAHPPLHMPMPRWDWGTSGSPLSRVSALAPVATEPEKVTLPADNETLHFDQHIKPLFRTVDRQSMKWLLDLHEYKDVKAHAQPILQRLQNGSMPCDGAWPKEKVAVFQRWMDTGMQE